MDIQQAHKSVKLARAIRSILNSVENDGEQKSQEVAGLVQRIEKILNETPNDKTPWEWRTMDAGLCVLASQFACRRIARGGEGDLQVERLKLDVLTEQLKELLSQVSYQLPDGLEEARQTLLGEGDCDGGTLGNLLLALPLPTLYWRKSTPPSPFSEIYNQETVQNPMVRLITFLDGYPIVSPHLLRSNLLYSLEFQVRGVNWPRDASHFHLTLTSTCPAEEYSLSDFMLARPPGLGEDEQFEGKMRGNIRFKSGQSSLLDELIFAVHGAFETDQGTLTETPLIGHSELRLRVTSESGHPVASGNRPMDRHLTELITTLVSDCPNVKDEMPELREMLQSLAILVATYAQEAIYKGESDISEQEFQRTVVRDLRIRLGQEVQEHPAQAGGITDIRYKGVIVEVKVERKNGDRVQIAEKYKRQVAQYTSIEARQVSVLLVLDLTSKVNPPGDIRDDIILTDVETHGGGDPGKKYPSKAFVFVINGNVKSPSAYSA